MSLKVILKNQGSTNFFTVAYKLAYASKNLDENMCINSLVLNGFLLKISALFFFWEIPISQYLLRVYLWYQSNILKRYFCKSSVYKVNWTVQKIVNLFFHSPFFVVLEKGFMKALTPLYHLFDVPQRIVKKKEAFFNKMFWGLRH